MVKYISEALWSKLGNPSQFEMMCLWGVGTIVVILDIRLCKEINWYEKCFEFFLLSQFQVSSTFRNIITNYELKFHKNLFC